MKSTKKTLIHPIVVMAAADIIPIKSILGTTKGRMAPGAYYLEHEDYYKGKKGYIITWGTANKHDLIHQFCSDVDENSRDSTLADAAEKEKLDKFKPKAYAYLSDMRYKSDGWNYKARTKPAVHQKKLSAIVDECKDVNFIPLNTRLDNFEYKFNKSTLFWKEGVTNAQPGDKVKLFGTEGLKLGNQRRKGEKRHEQQTQRQQDDSMDGCDRDFHSDSFVYFPFGSEGIRNA